MLLGLKAATYRIGTTVLLDQVDFQLKNVSAWPWWAATARAKVHCFAF